MEDEIEVIRLNEHTHRAAQEFLEHEAKRELEENKDVE